MYIFEVWPLATNDMIHIRFLLFATKRAHKFEETLTAGADRPSAGQTHGGTVPARPTKGSAFQFTRFVIQSVESKIDLKTGYKSAT